MKIIELDTTDSTNEYLKRCDCGEDMIVTARRQTGGRGTKGRSFVSDDGGLYLSVMRHFSDFPAKDAFKIMINACVAVCRTVEAAGAKPRVRWANDVLVGNKKICGTLIENTFSGGNIVRSIVGMGINVCNTLPDSLKDIAISLKECVKVAPTVEECGKILIKNLEREYALDDYKGYIDWFGREITLADGSGRWQAVALDIDGGGNLIVLRDGIKIKVSAAEVSLRL